jgi:hypothetical protein
MPDIDQKWNLSKIPPKGHKDVADFAASLFEIAKEERERLNKPTDFLSNYALYRGRESGRTTTRNKAQTPVNLYFANIERTVSNITAREPVGEVVDLDGIDDGAETMLTNRLKKWWETTGQQTKTRLSAKSMEVYGITVEKPYWDQNNLRPDIEMQDPYGFFPAPGNFDDISIEAPFVAFAYLDTVASVEELFKVKDVAEDAAYELLGVEREEYKADNYKEKQRMGNYDDPMYRSKRNDKAPSSATIKRCLILEVWVRDTRERTIKDTTAVIDQQGFPEFDDKGYPLYDEMTQKEFVYPDQVRKITITKRKQGAKSEARSDYMVLDDSSNPNINPRIDPKLTRTTHPWGRFPVYHANSYRDLVSIWGFAAAEQVGDLVVKINKIFTKLMSYVINVMAPPLIVQQHCGISRNMIESELTKGGRLVLMPTTPNARIEFMQIPNLPQTFFQMLEMVINLFDRVYQIEDADRGQAPKGVIAASAIVALQERNQVLMQSKTSSIDNIAEQRSKWAIGLWQNWGTKEELIELAEEPAVFIGTDFIGRNFSYVVEAGSSTPRTSLQIQEMAQKLFEMQAIDRRALLEAINYPKWQEIIERMGETELDAALQVLIDSGLPEEVAIQMKQQLMLPQGGPGDTGQGAVKKVSPAGPKSGQGQMPPAEVRAG